MNSHIANPCLKVLILQDFVTLTPGLPKARLAKSKHNHRHGNVTDLDSTLSGEQVYKVVGHTVSCIT